MKIINDIKTRGIDSAYIEGPFDKSLKALKSQGYRLISLEENAQLRMQEGKEEFVLRKGNWVKEGVLYIPEKGRFITKNSAVFYNPKKATQSHRDGKGYFVSDAQVERVLENSIQIPYNLAEISTNGFEDEEITAFCFGKSAKDYGLF